MAIAKLGYRVLFVCLFCGFALAQCMDDDAPDIWGRVMAKMGPVPPDASVHNNVPSLPRRCDLEPATTPLLSFLVPIGAGISVVVVIAYIHWNSKENTKDDQDPEVDTADDIVLTELEI